MTLEEYEVIELALRDQLDKIASIEQLMQDCKEADVQPPMDVLSSYMASFSMKEILQKLYEKFKKH